MTQTQTSRRMHYRKHATRWDSNPTSHYFLPRHGRLHTKGSKILWHWMEKMGMKISAGHTQISFGNIFSETVGAEWRWINRNLLPELGMPIVQVCGGDVGKGLPALKGQWSGLWQCAGWGMGNRTLPWCYEIESFVKTCHGHFPLKQYTLEAEQHLVAVNLHGLLTWKWRESLFYSSWEITMRPSLRARGRRKQEKAPARTSASALSKEVSFTVTMIFVNGPRVTAYCDATAQNKNLISLQWKPLFWKHLN